MAQKRYWNWLDDDSTNAMNQRDLVINPYGLYCGFDYDPDNTIGMSMRIVHTVTGHTKIKQDLTETPQLGIWKSKQGVIVTEDAPMNIPIAVGHATLPRIDLIVARHKFITTSGGAAATYEVIQGTPNASPVAPALTHPNEQIILGSWYIPATTTALATGALPAGLGYTKVEAPDFNNNSNYMRLDNKSQTAEGVKTFNALKGKEWVFAAISGGGVGSSNSFLLTAPANFYYLDHLDDDYYLMDRVTFADGSLLSVGDTHRFTVLTQQRLLLKNNTATSGITVVTSHNADWSTTGVNDAFYVEPNTLLEFVEISDYAGMTGNNRRWMCMSAGEMHKDQPNKLGHVLMAQKSYVGTWITREFGWSGAKRVSGLPSNYVEGFLDFSGAANELRAVQSMAGIAHTASGAEAGTVIYMRLYGNSGVACTLKHMYGGSITAGFKPFSVPNGGDLSVVEGNILVLIEDTAAWRVLQLITSNSIKKQPYELLFNDTVDVTGSAGNIGVVKTYTMPANTVLNVGDILRIKGTITLGGLASAGNIGDVYIDIGTLQYYMRIVGGAGTPKITTFEIEVVKRTGTNVFATAKAVYQSTVTTGGTLDMTTTGANYSNAARTGSIDFAVNQVIKITGFTDGVPTTAQGNYMSVELIRKQ